MKKIFNIPCHFSSQMYLDIVRETLAQIKARRPKDFLRLQILVRAIRLTTFHDGTVGEWKKQLSNPRDDIGYPGVLFLGRGINRNDLPAIISHELGHAATTLLDTITRDCPLEELTSEVAADWYAYEWGFGKQIAQARKTRDYLHHGPPPGSFLDFDTETTGVVIRCKLTRNFVWKYLGRVQVTPVIPKNTPS